MGNKQGTQLLNRLSITPGKCIGTTEFDQIWYSIKSSHKDLSHKKALLLLKKISIKTETEWNKEKGLELIKELDPEDSGFISYYEMKILFAYSLTLNSGEILSTSLKELASHGTVEDALRQCMRTSTPVVLNVYDLHTANDYGRSLGLGAFHTGIEILGYEWTFTDGAGIFCCEPKNCPIGVFKASIQLGKSNCTADKFGDLITQVRDEDRWSAHSYDMISNNCNHFCNFLSLQLVQKTLPKSIMRLSKIAKTFKGIIPNSIKKLPPLPEEESSETLEQFMLVLKDEQYSDYQYLPAEMEFETESHEVESVSYLETENGGGILILKSPSVEIF